MISKKLLENVETFPKNNAISKADIWLNIEHITYLTIHNEIAPADAARYASKLFAMLEEMP